VATLATLPLPHELHVFATSGPGPVDPAVLVGFNPQPEPPGNVNAVSLRNPVDPSITLPGRGSFTVLFGMHGPTPGDPYSIAPGIFTDHGDGTADYQFAVTGDGSVFQASFDISGYGGGWVGFNPQPDPPGDFGLGSVGFVFDGDPMLTWHIDAPLPGGNEFAPLRFREVPEPAGLGLLLLGAGAVMRLRRSPRRS